MPFNYTAKKFFSTLYLQNDFAIGKRMRPVIPDGKFAFVRAALVNIADANVANEETLLEDILCFALELNQHDE
jgi:hypothetical protein